MALRIILVAILAFLLWRVGWRLLTGIFEGMGYRPPGWKPESVGLVRDPICGQFVVPSQALRLGTGGDTRYFCSEKCRQEYGARER